MVGFFFFKQKTAYEMRISDWSSDVCSSDLAGGAGGGGGRRLSPQMGRAADPVGRAETRRRDERGGDRRLPQRQGRQMVASRRGGVRRRTAAHRYGQDFEAPDQIGRASCRERVCQYV